MSTDRLAIAKVLEEIAGLLEFRGENPFRVRAFRNAARAVVHLPGSAAAALADGSLAATRGIGPATLAIVRELVEQDRSSYLEELRREAPAGLLELLEVPGLGASRIRTLHQRLGVASLAELEAAARDGRLLAVPGFGPKTVEKLLKGIGFARGARRFRLWPEAAAEAEVLRSAVTELAGITRAETAGAVRRRAELVGELAFAAAGELSAAALRAALARLPGLELLPGSEPEFRTVGGLVARVVLAPPQSFGAALLHATGSAAHLEALAARVAARGLRLEPARLLRAGVLLPVPDEAAVYDALGLPPVPPELREGLDELALAEQGSLPKLVERADLAGLVHCHTTYSDGTRSVREMALAARTAGYSYIGITDHSRSAAYAGGLSLEQVAAQAAEIDALNRELSGIRVLKGIESDILADGSLDYPPEVLAGFDFVIGSVHGRLALSREEMTDRMLRALDDPHLTVLGHPTGRLLLARDPYPLEVEQVLARAAANRVALEINGDPHRLDLDWRLVRRGRELGASFLLGADAHGVPGLGFVDNALAMARKGGLTRMQVLNTRSADEFLAFAAARRS